MDKQTMGGFWYFPNNPETNFFGTLSLSDGSIELSLVECRDTPKELFTIYGFTQKGEKITLLECQCLVGHISIPGFVTCDIDAKYAILGDYIEASNCKFENATIKLSNLDHWLDVSGFSDYSCTENKITLNHSTPEPITLFSEPSKEFSFIFRRYAPLFTPFNRISIHQEAFIRIQHQVPFDLEKLWEDVTKISCFLTLAYYAQPKILSVAICYKDNHLDCYLRGLKNADFEEKKHRLNFLFTRTTISNSLQDVFKNWMDLGETATPVLYALHEGFSDRPKITEDKFLNIVHALETFHRRTRNNEDRPKVIHKQSVKVIVESCPEEHKVWLKEKLSYSNEPSLKNRLTSLFSEINEILIHRFFPDYESIINDTRNTRNYYTHYDSRLEAKALKSRDLSTLTQRLQIFLLILLLSEIKIPEQQLMKILIDGSNFHFNHLIKNKEKKKT